MTTRITHLINDPNGTKETAPVRHPFIVWLQVLAVCLSGATWVHAADAWDASSMFNDTAPEPPWLGSYAGDPNLRALSPTSYPPGPHSYSGYGVDRSDWQWHILPKGFIYSTYWASAAEPRLATHVVKDLRGNWLLDSHIGGRVGMVRFGPMDRDEGWQLDVLGGAKLRQDIDEELDVFGTDFRYDILMSYGVGPVAYKFGFYHVSSHVGDEWLLKNEDFERLNYFRDGFVFGLSYFPNPRLRLYGEVGWAFAIEISRPWELQFGIDYGPAHPTGIAGAPFAAINTHLRQELDFGGNLALQLGWAWRGQWSDGILRTGMYYYNGYSPQFSFYQQNEQQLGWGLWYDF